MAKRELGYHTGNPTELFFTKKIFSCFLECEKFWSYARSAPNICLEYTLCSSHWNTMLKTNLALLRKYGRAAALIDGLRPRLVALAPVFPNLFFSQPQDQYIYSCELGSCLSHLVPWHSAHCLPAKPVSKVISKLNLGGSRRGQRF